MIDSPYLNDNTPLPSNAASSKKMKRQTKMISIIRNSLKEHDRSEKLSEFNDVIQTAFGLTQQKVSISPTMGMQMSVR